LLSVRVRLARNLRGTPYWNRLPDDARARLADMLLGERAALSLELFGGRLRRLSPQDLQQLADCGLAPRAAARAAAPESDGVATEQALAYCGDEDHIRLQWIALEPPPGQAAALALRGLELCRRFDELYDWQHNPDFGWLTACPALAGQALRVSFLLNIAALVRAGIWPAWRNRLLAYGLEIRGADGEGSPETDFVQLSNRHWPRDADPEREIRRLTALVERIVVQEISLRSKVGPPESDMS
jgi:protein arginine kinase